MKSQNLIPVASLRTSRAKAAGFSLIELMVSITIGLVIIASLVGVLSATSSSSSSNDRESDLVTNGRYALDSMKLEIRKAGFKGYTYYSSATSLGTPSPWTAPSSGCYETGSSAGAFISNFHQGIWGGDNSNPFSANCIPGDGTAATSSYAANTDVLVLRRLSDFPLGNTTALAANTIYFQSTYTQGQLFRSTSAAPVRPTFPGAQQPLDTFALQTYVYYISPFTVSSAEVPLIPSLCRMAIQPDGSMARELVVSGIERMQIQYGVQKTDPNTGLLTVQYVETLAGGPSDNATVAAAWDTVKSVRLWLLARGTTAEPGYVNKQTYPMGNQSYTPNDGFRRQLFSTIVELRN